MNSIYKPYRLINSHELNALENAFKEKLRVWNEQYALFPLTCELRPIPLSNSRSSVNYCETTPMANNDVLMVCEEDQPIALLLPLEGKGVRGSIQHHLFGDTADCMNSLSDTLFLTLINQLLGTQTPQLHSCNTQNLDEWFYTGSPALLLNLTNITLYLNPQWVINALPSYTKTQAPIKKLSEAIDPLSIPLHVELSPVSLRLNDIIQLKIGDVIKTDHPITIPLQLKQNQKTICSVEIGEANAHKSIQITRPS